MFFTRVFIPLHTHTCQILQVRSGLQGLVILQVSLQVLVRISQVFLQVLRVEDADNL